MASADALTGALDCVLEETHLSTSPTEQYIEVLAGEGGRSMLVMTWHLSSQQRNKEFRQ